MLKSHACGALGAEHDGVEVRLAGWVNAQRDHGGVLFVDLRDSAGVVQVVCEDEAVADEAHRVRDEWCLFVRGTVRRRPEGTVNPNIPTGEVEVVASELEVLSESPPVPFAITDDVRAEESTRLRYRFLDLRRRPMLDALRLRSRVTGIMHDYMRSQGFVEVETPILAASTPEGARDFLVPSRLQRGKFFALAQSPQLFKQILMVSGVERYYQIARCLRDEDPRADRSIGEHTQLDIEMSFATQDDVFDLCEHLIQRLWRECIGTEIQIPFQRMGFDEAVARYGTDKPDLRAAAGPAIEDLSGLFADTSFNAFAGVLADGGAVRGLCVPGAGADASRAFLDGLIDRAKELGAKGIVWMVVEPDDLRAPVAKFLSEAELKGIRTQLEAEPGDLVLLAADAPRAASELLGTFRTELARSGGRVHSPSDPADWRFLWVVDFPLFEWSPDEDRWDAAHNPFSSPTPDSIALLDTDPGACRSLNYDFVCNGIECFSGAVRIHRPDVQQKVFEVMGLEPEQVRERFGWFVDALRWAAPPHAGFGMGVDRVVMLLAGTENIREVTAFPKTQSGGDLLTGAPTPVEPRFLRELGIRVVGEEKP
jgi:aspartyl-tRNA synthetase